MLVKWIFANVALNPVLGFTAVSESERNELSKNTSLLMERLTLSDCRKEAVAALKYEGSDALQASDRILGSTAARGLLNDPKVQAGLGEISKFVDNKKWSALYEEAGVPAPAPQLPN